MSSTSLIIPVYSLTGARLRNFEMLIPALARLDIPVIVAEQNSTTPLSVDLPPHWKHFIMRPTTGLFQKARLINQAVLLTNTKFVWMLDADVYFNYQSMLDQIYNQDAVQPFDRIIILTEEETQQFASQKRIAFHQGDNRHWMVPFGPHTFVVHRSVYDSIGGMNERYEGYGWEDLEFAWKVVTRYKVECHHLPALHLHHQKSATNPVNTEVFRRSGADIDQLIAASRAMSGNQHFAGGIEKRELAKKPCLQPIPWLEGEAQ